MNNSPQSSDSTIAPDKVATAPENKTASLASADRLREVARMLSGEPETEAPAPPAAGKSKEPMRTLEQAAKALGITAAELYELEVPLRSGAPEAKKLGELKDYFAGQDDHRVEQLAWSEQRVAEQAELERTRQELAEIVRAIPPDKMNKQVVDAARRRHENAVAVERTRTLARIPQWSDDATRTSELTGIAEHLASYGLPAESLASIFDHRMLAYLRDNWQRKARVDAALERVKPVRPGTPPRSGRDPTPNAKPVRPQAGARAHDTQVSAISKLLNGS